MDSWRTVSRTKRPARRRLGRLAGMVLAALLLVVAGTAPDVRGTASAASGTTPSRSVPLPFSVYGMADDPVGGHIVVLGADRRQQDLVALVDAATGRVRATTVLSTTVRIGGKLQRTPIGVTSPAVFAVDAPRRHIFVLTGGPYDGRQQREIGNPVVFMLDADTGAVLRATTLHSGRFWDVISDSILLDAAANRVFVGYNSFNALSVLDATTGAELRPIAFPFSDPTIHAGPAVPMGLDQREGGIVVIAPYMTVLVDPLTGQTIRKLQQTAGVSRGLVDGIRGRAVLAEDGYNETVDLRTGKRLHTRDILNSICIALLLDERTGRALLFCPPDGQAPGSIFPSYLSIIDDMTGKDIGPDVKLSLGAGANGNAAATAIINPITGHAIVSTRDDLVHGPVHVAVVDLHAGRVLRQIPFATTKSLYRGMPVLAADAATRHVFMTDANGLALTIYDAATL